MEFRVAQFGSPEQLASVELRRRILRGPLGLDFTREELAAEEFDEHLLALDGEDVVAVAVLTPIDKDVVKMRQVAVVPDRQGEGIGRHLVRFFEDRAQANGFKRIVLHARAPAVPFYLNLGYSVDGEPFEEVTIPHRRMVKDLFHE